MYYIDFNTGIGNKTAKTLESAFKKADKGAAYTQRNIDIINEDDEIVAAYGTVYHFATRMYSLKILYHSVILDTLTTGLYINLNHGLRSDL